jgi:hypothetical protein
VLSEVEERSPVVRRPRRFAAVALLVDDEPRVETAASPFHFGRQLRPDVSNLHHVERIIAPAYDGLPVRNAARQLLRVGNEIRSARPSPVIAYRASL